MNDLEISSEVQLLFSTGGECPLITRLDLVAPLSRRDRALARALLLHAVELIEECD